MKRILNSVLALLVSVGSGSISLGQSAGRIHLFEDFHGNPATNGWKIFGDANLFNWNATNENVEVIWNSSRPNSYFYKVLSRPLSRDDEFSFYFDLRMRDIAIGTTTNKPYTFQVAVGLLNIQQATNDGFLRGTGFDSPNVFEFDYFPDSGFGATISPTVISSNNQFATAFVLKEITTNDWFRIILTANQGEGSISLRRNGELYASQSFQFPTNFTDFSVDTVAIASYSDEGQFPDFAGSILAHGTVDNIVVTKGPVPLNLGFSGHFENSNWRMDFDAFPGWQYTVYRTEDFVSMAPVGTYDSTNYGRGAIIVTNPPAVRTQFYRLEGLRQ